MCQNQINIEDSIKNVFDFINNRVNIFLTNCVWTVFILNLIDALGSLGQRNTENDWSMYFDWFKENNLRFLLLWESRWKWISYYGVKLFPWYYGIGVPTSNNKKIIFVFPQRIRSWINKIHSTSREVNCCKRFFGNILYSYIGLTWCFKKYFFIVTFFFWRALF